jgi:hypothetical protein
MINNINISNIINTRNIYLISNSEGSCALKFPHVSLSFTLLRCEYEHY